MNEAFFNGLAVGTVIGLVGGIVITCDYVRYSVRYRGGYQPKQPTNPPTGGSNVSPPRRGTNGGIEPSKPWPRGNEGAD